MTGWAPSTPQEWADAIVLFVALLVIELMMAYLGGCWVGERWSRRRHH